MDHHDDYGRYNAITSTNSRADRTRESESDLFEEDVDPAILPNDLPPPLFTVTNPPATVSVTAAIDGSIRHIDLEPTVTKMTEDELAREILTTARLVRMQSLANAHAFLVEGLRASGYDASAVTADLTQGLGMPTLQQALEATAREYTNTYTGDTDDDDW